MNKLTTLLTLMTVMGIATTSVATTGLANPENALDKQPVLSWEGKDQNCSVIIMNLVNGSGSVVKTVGFYRDQNGERGFSVERNYSLEPEVNIYEGTMNRNFTQKVFIQQGNILKADISDSRGIVATCEGLK